MIASTPRMIRLIPAQRFSDHMLVQKDRCTIGTKTWTTLISGNAMLSGIVRRTLSQVRKLRTY